MGCGSGFVQGVGEERYEPNRLVSRQEFALILYRGAGSPDPYAYTLKDFADQGAVSGWARDAVRWCVGSGLLNGKDDKRLAPRDTIIVVEAALMLQRAEKSDSPEEESGVQAVSSLTEIKSCLRKAMTDAEQPPVFDIRALEGSTDPEIDVRNLYYALLSEQPELKYAYALDVEQGADARLTCTFSFMPYRTGNYPAGFAGERVSSLTELIAAARAGLDAPDSVQIRITDHCLTVDDMNKALQQVGGSYILCQLNADGTAITYTPLNALSYAEALDRLRDIDTLADMVLASTVDGAMTARERGGGAVYLCHRERPLRSALLQRSGGYAVRLPDGLRRAARPPRYLWGICAGGADFVSKSGNSVLYCQWFFAWRISYVGYRLSGWRVDVF